MYLVDGAQNLNRMDGGYALKLPVEAVAEFRILTQSAPAEYGGTAGATTSIVTRLGGNQFPLASLRVLLRLGIVGNGTAQMAYSQRIQLVRSPARHHARVGDVGAM